MPGVVAGLRIDLVNRVIDGHRRLAEASGNQFQLPFVRADVARRVDARKIRFETVVDPDRVLFEIQPPLRERAEIRLEADEGEDGVDFVRRILVGPVVEDRDGLDAIVAVDRAHLAVREQLDLPARDRFVQQLHRMRMRAESFPPVDQDDPACPAAQVQHPVHRAVTAPDDEHALPLVVRRVLHVVGDASAEQRIVARTLQHAWRECAFPRGDQDRPRRVGVQLRMHDVVVANPLEPPDLLLEPDICAELESLLDHAVPEVAREDAWQAAHVVDVLLGVQRHQLPAQLRQRIDDARSDAAHAGVECGEQAGRPAADDRDVACFRGHGHIGTKDFRRGR